MKVCVCVCVCVCVRVSNALELANEKSWEAQSFTTMGFIYQRCIKNGFYVIKFLYIGVNGDDSCL